MRKDPTGGTVALNIMKKMTFLIIAIGIIVRCIMIATSNSNLDISAWQYVIVFLIGALNDTAFAIVSLVPIWLFTASSGDRKFLAPRGFILLLLLISATVYLGWFCPALQEFNRGLSRVVKWVMIYWTATFAIRMFVPEIRKGWTRIWLTVILFVYVTIMITNAAGEYFFWDEFGVRYNFIAVDYLVYTSEVIGNILESYPIVPLSIGLIILSGIITTLLFKREIKESVLFASGHWRIRFSIGYLICLTIAVGTLTLTRRLQQTDNTYFNELQANGAYSFYQAFMKNELDYNQFYLNIPQADAESIINEIYQTMPGQNRHIAGDSTERHLNIVLITMESMSASFMNRFGSDENLTPNLDSLYSRGIAFDRMYANGNRTVRGLEALSLALPPAAGQSLIKRPDLELRQSIGGVLKEKGYRPIFFYGGKSYFDNMGPFFRNMGYDVVDIDSFKPDEITFRNIWGTCDGDSYSKMLKEIDRTHSSGQPFFAHMMTISNHRPYTYPEGCIDIPTDSKSRAGGVKYADYALGSFMKEAAKKPWFANTVFVIIADHCASSAGETKLPPENYHIPALIYSPENFAPTTIDYPTAQIDLMPTVMGLLGMSYDTSDYGLNVMSGNYTPRAFLATYQDLGYMESDTLTVLSPGKKVEQFRITDRNGEESLEKISEPSKRLVNKAAALYQTAAAR